MNRELNLEQIGFKAYHCKRRQLMEVVYLIDFRANTIFGYLENGEPISWTLKYVDLLPYTTCNDKRNQKIHVGDIIIIDNCCVVNQVLYSYNFYFKCFT